MIQGSASRWWKLVAALATLAAARTEWAGAEQGAGPRIVHSVYFTLHEDSPAARQQLVAACEKYLRGHEGEVFFAAGPLAEQLNRPVNDRNFHVALLVVFRDQAAHDKYQDHERHLKFIDENKARWKTVRVFDSEAAGAPRSGGTR